MDKLLTFVMVVLELLRCLLCGSQSVRLVKGKGQTLWIHRGLDGPHSSSGATADLVAAGDLHTDQVSDGCNNVSDVLKDHGEEREGFRYCYTLAVNVC